MAIDFMIQFHADNARGMAQKISTELRELQAGITCCGIMIMEEEQVVLLFLQMRVNRLSRVKQLLIAAGVPDSLLYRKYQW